MKFLIGLSVFLFLLSCGKKDRSISFEKEQAKNELMAHIRFLASDELKGRKAGKPETKIAARYIAEQFRAAGLQRFNTINDFLQPTEFVINDKMVFCNNVVGFIAGTNPKFKNEYVLLCAHFDHLGVEKDGDKPNSDSIYNGARDNAMGTVALIFAAKELSKLKPERSVIFLASTGEEDGMLGSNFFIGHCPIPMNDIVFVINNDGGGFNDTTLIRIGGKNYIDFPADFWRLTESYGIACLPYPKELEYLYERGDNITFAQKGIPAITISPGFNEIDEQILKYIHKPGDEAKDDFDYSYLLKFSCAFTEYALRISNSDSIPFWKQENKFVSKGQG